MTSKKELLRIINELREEMNEKFKKHRNFIEDLSDTVVDVLGNKTRKQEEKETVEVVLRNSWQVNMRDRYVYWPYG